MLGVWRMGKGIEDSLIGQTCRPSLTVDTRMKDCMKGINKNKIHFEVGIMTF